ncbi:unnamed protein product [Angiostrongylus costaricensis]|uniref:Rab3 GTPase-activating protein catalytic subunit n=1 Tax=Angiostrongylus costaricensis TaxID=334426 RepID=A0A0R3PJ79_ANGCS|nr:unnamed protein product [Angiostrongylus costaricensis]
MVLPIPKVPISGEDVDIQRVNTEVDDWKDFCENTVLRQNKWTPPDSLTCRFANAFANASLDFVFGTRAFAQTAMCLVNVKSCVLNEFFDAQSGHSDDDSSANVSLDEDATLKSTMDSSKIAKLPPDRSPMTEDMVEEFSRYLSSLDDGESRVQAQLDVLSSDMQAFKAANPKCCIEDFIRWHSPKDWDEEKECLSERMQLQDNAWVKCWNEAMPIPVVNQTRLFNESKVAEEILSMLENANVQQMVELLLPVLFTSAVLQVIHKGKSISNLLDKDLLVHSVCRANKSGLRDDYMEALKHLKAAEILFSRYSSLWNKLRTYKSDDAVAEQPTESDLLEFITLLIEDATSKRETVDRNVISRGVPIFGASTSPLGNAVRTMLERYSIPGGLLPPPYRKQYIMRWSVPRPSANSRELPQRLFASIEQDEFRLCGSFLEDTVYT